MQYLYTSMYMYVYVLLCRFTTIPGRTKGKRKVQIKLSNCRALQPSDKLAPRPVQTVGSGGGEVGGGREGRASECPAVNAK